MHSSAGQLLSSLSDVEVAYFPSCETHEPPRFPSC